MFFLECCVFDTDEGNGLFDSLDLARTLFLDRKLLAWRLHDPNTGRGGTTTGGLGAKPPAAGG